MFKWLKKSEPEKEVIHLHPLERLAQAVDEVNAAVDALPSGYKMYRPWVRAGDRATRRRSELMLGYWNTGGRKFEVIYGKDVLDQQINLIDDIIRDTE